MRPRVLLVLSLLACAAPSRGDMFTCVDAAGKTRLTNKPCAAQETVRDRLPESASQSAPAATVDPKVSPSAVSPAVAQAVSSEPAPVPKAAGLAGGPERTVEAVLTWRLKAPDLNADEWIVYAAAPPRTDGQTVFSASLEPYGVEALELSSLQRPVLFSRVVSTGRRYASSIDLRAAYRVRLRPRRLRTDPTDVDPLPVPALSPSERSRWLSTSPSYELDSAGFRSWLDENKLHRGPSETDLDFARRVFLFLTGNLSYAYEPHDEGRLSTILKKGSSDCGGLAIVFVSTLRANKIPARILMGRWAQSARPGPDEFQYHVKAEFYAEGAGWVPVDVAGKLFGEDRGDFIVFHFDADLVLDTLRFGPKPVWNLQNPALWAGSGSGSFDGSTTTQDWRVRTLDP